MYNWRFHRTELIKNTSGKAVYLTSPQSQYLCHIGLGRFWGAIDVATFSWVSGIQNFPKQRLCWNLAVTLNLEPQRGSEGNLPLANKLKQLQ